eukprot:gene9495-32478_t
MLRKIKSAPGSLHAMELEPGREGIVAMSRLTQSFSQPARGRTVSRAIGLEVDMPSRLRDALQRIENEVVLESSLHVTSFQAVECAAQFGFAGVELSPTQGLARVGLPSAPDLYQGGGKSSRSLLTMLQGKNGLDQESAMSLAACLASPSEAEEAHEVSLATCSGSITTTTTTSKTQVKMGNEERYYEWVRRVRRQRRLSFIVDVFAALGSGDEPDPLSSPIMISSKTQVDQLHE